MKRWLFVTICAFCIFAFVKTSVTAEVIEVEKEFLEEILERLERDRVTIRELRILRDELEQRNWLLEAKIKTLETQIRHAKGFYLGGGIGYPLPMGIGFVEYRFSKWSPIGFVGYGGNMFIGLGVNFKIGKK